MLILLTLGCRAEPCNQHETCDWDEFCHEGRCRDGFERPFEIGIGGGDAGLTHPDGYAWDGDDTPPDLLVEMTTDVEVCWTHTEWDTYEPQWWVACDMWISRDPVLYIDVWEQDGSIDEYATSWVWEGKQDLIELIRTNGRMLELEEPTDSIRIEVWMQSH